MVLEALAGGLARSARSRVRQRVGGVPAAVSRACVRSGRRCAASTRTRSRRWSRHDDQYRGDLLPTLESYLGNDCNMNATARAIYAHRHTVAYRLERVKELTGLDPLPPRTANGWAWD